VAKVYGKWSVFQSLGEGGQGHTFIVRNVTDGSEGVLKRLKNAGSPERLRRFHDEAEAARMLDHPGIPRILDMNLEKEPLYIVFEYRQGRNLKALANENRGPLELLKVLVDLHAIMSHVHAKGLCHRDLKPEHVIVGEDVSISVIDFGLVYFHNGERVTMVDEAVGSYFYVAPELEDGKGIASAASDVYALGKLVYFALSGGRIFNREKHRDETYDLVRIRNDARYERISSMLDKMITADPVKRFPTANEAMHGLEDVMSYFAAVEWERTFTIKKDELVHHKDAWIPSGKGWYTNHGHQKEDWTIYGPYTVEPRMPIGLYEAIFVLRSRIDPNSVGQPVNGRAIIDAASAAGGVSGTAILASRRLSPEDLSPSQSDPAGWREHSILFFYDGQGEIEFRVRKDTQKYAKESVMVYDVTLEFLSVRVRRVSSLTPNA